MLLSAVSVLVVAQSSSEIPEGLMNNPVYSISIPVYFFPQGCINYNNHDISSLRLFTITNSFCLLDQCTKRVQIIFGFSEDTPLWRKISKKWNNKHSQDAQGFLYFIREILARVHFTFRTTLIPSKWKISSKYITIFK